MVDPLVPSVRPAVEQSRDSGPISFKPQVRPPVARMRPVFAAALLATAAFALGAIAWGWLRPRPTVNLVEPAELVLPRGCTSLEVEEVIRAATMTDVERVTCLAVAGKIDRARELLLGMTEAMRTHAIAQVFQLAHPIADRGDDASAGPIMALVVEFWPANYMAVFHAGMAEFALGHDELAGLQLERFLGMYHMHDVWRQRAEQALTAIAAHIALDKRQAHFRE
ncbi:MAG TPA: hypothetical protein VK607_22600 [Kofleriaceae bacterium]|nr:hypothetical protein [Kofleriaceae bacterium]HMG57574.1 hypothetical protein [Kofleriaceae bacterium]